MHVPDISKEQLYIILGVIAVVLMGCVVGVFKQKIAEKPSSPESSPAPILIESKAKNEQVRYYVQISGAVMREGVYKLNKGDRLIDLIRLSGASLNADLDSINLAEPLSDGQKVIIPARVKGPVGQNNEIPLNTSGDTGKVVNINIADEKQLDSLPGIGPTMAKRIVDHRKEKGSFCNIEELKEVPGISAKKFDKLKDKISVN